MQSLHCNAHMCFPQIRSGSSDCILFVSKVFNARLYKILTASDRLYPPETSKRLHLTITMLTSLAHLHKPNQQPTAHRVKAPCKHTRIQSRSTQRHLSYTSMEHSMCVSFGTVSSARTMKLWPNARNANRIQRFPIVDSIPTSSIRRFVTRPKLTPAKSNCLLLSYTHS